ncbi:hypothetical protein F383_07350 [Gossypium arboreum]|uniref:Uncharacterized protein n=1 Tax=Gossypium arboreum TaxID=29729 RepID=A0A0B0NB15_GOSAR|nr:hypothetical protein F383_07350 [Gossypium arboreum]
MPISSAYVVLNHKQ